MSGGHFIIINGFIDGKVNIINPIKDKYESRKETIEFLINWCINYGSWRMRFNKYSIIVLEWDYEKNN